MLLVDGFKLLCCCFVAVIVIVVVVLSLTAVDFIVCVNAIDTKDAFAASSADIIDAVMVLLLLLLAMLLLLMLLVFSQHLFVPDISILIVTKRSSFIFRSKFLNKFFDSSTRRRRHLAAKNV